MTPWHLMLACDAYKEREGAQVNFKKWLCWHGAVLGRVKEVPSLDKFVGQKKREKFNERDMINQLKMLQAAMNKQDKP